MKGEWCYFNKYLDKDICDRIVNDLKPLTRKTSGVGFSDNASVDLGTRKSKTCFIHSSEPKYSYIFDIFWETANIANKEFFNFQISRLNFLQFAEYNSDELAEYKAHRDVFWINDDQFYHRKLSGMLQLSDPKEYVGGMFEITDYNINSKPKAEDILNQGSILYIPSFIEHRVAPVIKGVRYSLVAWFEGPKWR